MLGFLRHPNLPSYHIAKSVAKWTWRRDAEAQAKFLARQAEKGRKGAIASGKVRLAASEDLRASARLMLAQGMSKGEISRRLGVPKPTIILWFNKGVSEA
jgi:DNA invertase Pin-like site-specific DNA recombinase